MLSAIKLSAPMLSVLMLSAIMLSVPMLSVFMLSDTDVLMLSVFIPMFLCCCSYADVLMLMFLC